VKFHLAYELLPLLDDFLIDSTPIPVRLLDPIAHRHRKGLHKAIDLTR
jgi:hypothetical protein